MSRLQNGRCWLAAERRWTPVDIVHVCVSAPWVRNCPGPRGQETPSSAERMGGSSSCACTQSAKDHQVSRRTGAGRGLARTRTAASSASCCRTPRPDSTWKASAAGSMRNLFQARSSSTLAKFWSSRRTAIYARTCIASLAAARHGPALRRMLPGGATVPLLRLSPELGAQAGGVTHDPLNPLFRDVGRNYLKSRLRSAPGRCIRT